ncbi:hypothetical protein Mapa_011882 [Marchantia paleacea]|nr:hypothetical protein Mapa_011882 [Marchantia paleacea]
MIIERCSHRQNLHSLLRCQYTLDPSRPQQASRSVPVGARDTNGARTPPTREERAALAAARSWLHAAAARVSPRSPASVAHPRARNPRGGALPVWRRRRRQERGSKPPSGRLLPPSSDRGYFQPSAQSE